MEMDGAGWLDGDGQMYGDGLMVLYELMYRDG